MSDQPKNRDGKTVVRIPIRLVLEIELVITEPSVTNASPAPTETPPAEFNGALLRQRREAAGLTRDQLGALAGLSPATIRNIERRRHKPTAAILRKLFAVAELNLGTPRRKAKAE